MKDQWHKLADRFAAYKVRERALMFAATIAVVALGGHTLAVDPARLRSAALSKQIAQQKVQIAALEAQAGTLRSQSRDPDAANRASLAEARGRIADSEKALGRYASILVAPDQVPQLLQSLLGRHRGLTLVSLQSLTPEPLVALPEAKGGKSGDANPVKASLLPGANIYRHGIEIKVIGSYGDLLNYVAELEQAPQKLLWRRLNLAVVAYPRSELTLTIYTLSLDPRWLVV